MIRLLRSAFAAFAAFACVAFVAVIAACASTSPATAPAPAMTSTGQSALPLLGALVRAWAGGAGVDVRAIVKEAVVGNVNAAVIDIEGGVVVNSDRASVVGVVRLTDVVACHDSPGEGGGVVVGEPPRLVGCGAQDLFAVAAFVDAIVEGARGLGVVVVDDDAALARALAVLPPNATVWTGGGVVVEGADVDVFDAVVVDAGRVRVSLRAADRTRLARALGRAVSLAPRPRLPVVLAERERALRGVFADDADDYAADDDRRDFVVDRCVFASFDDDVASVDCVVVPGRATADLVDDVVRAVADPDVAVAATQQAEASSAKTSLPLLQTLTTRLQATWPRVVVVPGVDVGVGVSVCARARAAGHACVAALPLRVHPVERTRRGRADEAVDVAAVVTGAAFVADVARGVP